MGEKKSKKEKAKVKTEAIEEEETTEHVIRPSTDANSVSTESWPLLLKVLLSLGNL